MPHLGLRVSIRVMSWRKFAKVVSIVELWRMMWIPPLQTLKNAPLARFFRLKIHYFFYKYRFQKTIDFKSYYFKYISRMGQMETMVNESNNIDGIAGLNWQN